MKLYIQYAQPYEGYVSGRFDASTGVWEMLRLGDAPAHVDRLLGRSGVKFFLGTLGNRRCLCIRGIPDEIRDENGRACFIHMMVDAPLSQRRAVDRLAGYALGDTPRFHAEMQGICSAHPSQAGVRETLIRQLLNQVDDWVIPGRPCDTLMIPEHSLAHFTRETGIRIDPNRVHLLSAENAPVELYFYCSAPADGYTFTRVAGADGKTLARRDEAAAALPAGLYRRITTQGEETALFREEDRWCFFIRPIPTDQSGVMTLAAVSPEEAPLRRMAAWCKAHPEELRTLAAACIVPCPAEGEYAVDAPQAAALCRQLTAQPQARRVQPASPAGEDKPQCTGEDEGRINLKQCRWFWPAVIAAGALTSTGLVWMLIRLIN